MVVDPPTTCKGLPVCLGYLENALSNFRRQLFDQTPADQTSKKGRVSDCSILWSRALEEELISLLVCCYLSHSPTGGAYWQSSSTDTHPHFITSSSLNHESLPFTQHNIDCYGQGVNTTKYLRRGSNKHGFYEEAQAQCPAQRTWQQASHHHHHHQHNNNNNNIRVQFCLA